MSAPTLSDNDLAFLREFVDMAKKVAPILEKLSGQPRRGQKVAPRKAEALKMAGMTPKQLEAYFRNKLNKTA